MKKTQNNPHEQTLVMNQTEGYKLNQKLNELIWEGQLSASKKEG